VKESTRIRLQKHLDLGKNLNILPPPGQFFSYYDGLTSPMKARIFVPDQKDREIPMPTKLSKSCEKLAKFCEESIPGSQIAVCILS
jgi:hypothetical protein